MTRVRSLLQDQAGYTTLLFMTLAMMVGVLGLTLIANVTDEENRSASAVRRDTAFMAAEAGVDDYLAKLLDDPLYYAHYVHQAETTRRSTSGTLVTAGNTWTFGSTWTYPTEKNAWRAVSNGYEYNLQVTPPSAAQQGVRILATGRLAGSTNRTEWRSIDTIVRPAALSDFQMLADADISYGSGATTYGKIYAGIDSSGVKHNINHSGNAYANIYAEGSVTGSPTMHNGARTYNSTNIRTVIKNPVNFSAFLTSLTDIQRAATSGGVYLNNTAVDGWRLTFQSDGTFRVQSCTKASGQDVAAAAPTCGSVTSRTVPANGAIYAAQTVIVSGQVNGRVTVASNANVVIAADISYVSPGDDVLGLVAKDDMFVAQWVPTNLNWRAGTLAQSGVWRSWTNDGSHGTMTFTGSTATAEGGSMSLFKTRIYQYDDTLLYLPPPWFPTIGDAYTYLLFREAKP
jgi:Tfp pilus assembly protein PilX